MSTKESILFTHFTTTLTLLEIGLNYTEIQNLNVTEIVMLLATNASIQELKNEHIERNAKHQQAAASHPQFPSRF